MKTWEYLQRLVHTATESFKGGLFCSQIKIKPHTKGPHTFLIVWDIMSDFQKDKSIRCVEKQEKKHSVSVQGKHWNWPQMTQILSSQGV